VLASERQPKCVRNIRCGNTDRCPLFPTKLEVYRLHPICLRAARRLPIGYASESKAEAAPTAAEVASGVETWLAKNFTVNVDFKIADALATLNRFGLVRRERERLFVPPLEPAIAQLHQVWNNFFKRE